MKLKGKRSQQGDHYDADIGSFTNNYMLNFKGGGGSTTTTGPSPEQRAILNKQLGFADSMEALGPMAFYNKDTLADFNPFSEEGLQSQIQASVQADALGKSGFDRFQDAMSYDPTQDPRTGEYLDAMTQPLLDQFQEETIPGINSNAVASGAFGGDRADVLKATATGDLAGAMGDTRAKALTGLIDSNRSYQSNMMSQLGSLQDAALQPSQILRDVGQGYQDRSQAEIDADRERYEFGENAPRDMLRDASSMLGGIDFGSITKTTGGGGK